MKKSLFILPIICLSFLSSCAPTLSTLTFENDEYNVYSGDAVLVKEHNDQVDYAFVGDVPEGVLLNKDTGVITFDDTVLNSSQVLYRAYTSQIESNIVVLTLFHEQVASNLAFLNLTNKIVDGDSILATNSEGYAIKYTLKNDVYGVDIDESSGRISFASSCPHNQEFVVVISAKNSQPVEKTFYAVTQDLVTSINDQQACEQDGGSPISYFLDFSNAKEEVEILGVLYDKKILDAEDYYFDEDENQIFINDSFLNDLKYGENTLSIVTSNNNVNVTVIKANKFIRTPADLASIGESVEALNGYYILANDIDLTSYLSFGGEGYNEGKGWNALGVYVETTDGTATANAFNGTFDGNGFTIKGLRINRQDEYSYNAGLFGYVDSLSCIKNLSVIADSEEITVRSYSGILAGNNQGKIENCYVRGNITNYSGENLFKNLGLICGTNGGEITNCIAEGSVISDAYGGTLVGLNEGVINGCFSLTTNDKEQIGDGVPCVDSFHFTNKGSFLESDFSAVLDETHWDIQKGVVPKTKQYIEYFSVYSLEIVNSEQTIYTKGDKITIDVQIYPVSLHDKYINDVEFVINGEGIVLDNNKIDTTASNVNDFTITATLDAQGKVFSQTKQFHLYEVTSEIKVSDTVETTMNAGSSYRLKADVYPFGAYSNVKWALSGSYKGITLSEDIVTISEECTIKTFAVYAFNSQLKSPAYSINVNTFKNVINDTIVMYKNELQDLEFEFGSDLDLSDANAYIDNALIEIKDIRENTIVIDKKYLENIPNKTLRFKFILNDGSLYRGYATYFARDLYDIDYIESLYTQYHTISSVEDFARYFNILDTNEEGLGFSLDKHEYYDDVFVLTNDIDFNNQAIFGIGTYDSDTGTGVKFEGTIFGQGYSIKNVNIRDNEKWFINEDKTGNYRNSLYAVGFFGTFDGKIYDVVFDNVNVNANNWVAGFACTIGVNGYLENIKFINSTVASTGGTQGKIYCTNNGSNNLIVVSYNGSFTNLGR